MHLKQEQDQFTVVILSGQSLGFPGQEFCLLQVLPLTKQARLPNRESGVQLCLPACPWWRLLMYFREAKNDLTQKD